MDSLLALSVRVAMIIDYKLMNVQHDEWINVMMFNVTFWMIKLHAAIQKPKLKAGVRGCIWVVLKIQYMNEWRNVMKYQEG